jgi:hypothetical protein
MRVDARIAPIAKPHRSSMTVKRNPVLVRAGMV